MERLKTPDDIRLERITKTVRAIKGFYKHLAAYVLANAFLILSKFFELETGEVFLDFSTFSVAFFWGIGLAFHAVNVFGRNVFLGEDWEEKKIKEFMNKKQPTKWE